MAARKAQTIRPSCLNDVPKPKPVWVKIGKYVYMLVKRQKNESSEQGKEG